MSLSAVHRPRAAAAALIAALASFAILAPAALASSPSEPLSPAPSVPSGALAEGAFDGTEERVSARLLVDAERVQPGQTLRVGVLFDLDPGWHIYWRSPGSSGLPTELHWQDSADSPGEIEIGDIEWPTPGTFDEAEGLIVTYGYSGRVLLHASARVADDATGPIQLEVEAKFLVCEIACVPGELSLSRNVAVAATGEPASANVVALFDEAAGSKPLALAEYGLEAKVLYSQSAVRPGDRFEAAISLGCQGRAGCASPVSGEAALGYAFIPDLIEGMEVEVTQTSAHPLVPGDLLIELRGTAGAAPPKGPQRMSGVASLRLPDGRSVAAEVDLPLPRAAVGSDITSIGTPWRVTPAPSASGSTAAPISMWRAILFALLGGLILNLMPCVLPVLAIKVFAIAELAHSNHREVLANGAAYTAGVVGSMLVLAAAVIGIRAGGEAIGWGFQFQEPMFVAAISAVLVVFALNLFGVFEIFAPTASLANVGTGGSHTQRSFFEGLLAVVLATPCSAPFLGPAIGFAFAGSPASIVAIFVAIGVGLAFPFVAITLVPAWARFLPRSGAWMITLRSALGFAVLAPIVWLLWVVGQQVGNDGVAALLAFLVAVSFATWVYGIFQARGSTRAARAIAIASLAGALFALTELPLEVTEAAARDGETATESGDGAYSRAALANALEGGNAVFVYYTADWCITCKVNEKTTLADADVRAAFEKLGVTVLVADWTQRDEAIAHELARFGRAGVPLYLVYDARNPGSPVLLPEVLTPGLVIDAVTAAARG